MGAALNFLIEPLKHIGAFEMFVGFSGQPVKGERFLNVFFDPGAELLISLLPSQEPSPKVSAGFLGIAVDRKAIAIRSSNRQRLCEADNRARCGESAHSISANKLPAALR
jgi:hypothetical protein